MFVTDSISYNVRDRGRKARGQDRNFDTAALARLINGAGVQEKVKHGDMLGFLGHWPRIKFGMEPAEGGIVDGKAVVLPVAIRTIELSALPDGTITHRTEFLDTEHGQAALSLYKSKVGGFSSAIDTIPNTTPAISRGFHGFDFVHEPNFSKNRGHSITLDGVNGEDVAGLLDAVMLMAGEGDMEMYALFDSLHGQHLTALQAMERMARENDWLINRLAKIKGTDAASVLDGIAMEDVRTAPGRNVELPDFAKFKTEPLVGFASMQTLDNIPSTPESRYAEKRFGFKG
jgi:hypothetical protein